MTICAEVYRRTVTYSPPTFEEIPCFREVGEDGRHRGRHQGWVEHEETLLKATRPDGEDRLLPACKALVSWDRGGSSTDARGHDYSEHEPCPICGALTPPFDGDRTGWQFPGAHDAFKLTEKNIGGVCGACRTWGNRIAEYSEGWILQEPKRLGHRRRYRLVRQRLEDGTASDRLSAWQEGITGAFGNRWCKVTWDDGDTAGPQSSLWDAGAIPWWWDEHFPPNATVEWTARG